MAVLRARTWAATRAAGWAAETAELKAHTLVVRWVVMLADRSAGQKAALWAEKKAAL